MKSDYVRDWMSTNTVSIKFGATLPDAYELMKEYNIRRLPVVDGDNKLVGIIARSDVREAQPSDATSLSIYELNYLLAKLTIDKIMTKKVLTVTPDTTIAEAARLMLDYKVGGLPVVDDQKHVLGIITESDIFRLVVQRYAD
jgi:CBS domain-containing protein